MKLDPAPIRSEIKKNLSRLAAIRENRPKLAIVPRLKHFGSMADQWAVGQLIRVETGIEFNIFILKMATPPMVALGASVILAFSFSTQNEQLASLLSNIIWALGGLLLVTLTYVFYLEVRYHTEFQPRGHSPV